MSDPYGLNQPPFPQQPAPPPGQPQFGQHHYGMRPGPSAQPVQWAQPPTPVDPGPRPNTLTAVAWGMFVSVAIATVYGVLIILNADAGAAVANGGVVASESPAAEAGRRVGAMVGAVLTTGVQVGLWIWMAIAALQGIAWARVLATVFGGIGILWSIVALLGDAAMLAMGDTLTDPMLTFVVSEAVYNAVRLVIAIALLVLMWLPRSTIYYRAVTNRRKAQASLAYGVGPS